MIFDCSFWKTDLLKLASRLERRLVQSRWGAKNIYTVEKEVYFGLFAVRKLIESKKINEELPKKKYNLVMFPTAAHNSNDDNEMAIYKYGIEKTTSVMLSILDICNLFIHSFYFVPLISNGKNLIGFFFSSDRSRRYGVYFITVFDIVEIYRLIGNDRTGSD